MSLLIKAGLPINTISARVGHASPLITHNIYAHLLPRMNRMAVDVFERLVAAGNLDQSFTHVNADGATGRPDLESERPGIVAGAPAHVAPCRRD